MHGPISVLVRARHHDEVCQQHLTRLPTEDIAKTVAATARQNTTLPCAPTELVSRVTNHRSMPATRDLCLLGACRREPVAFPGGFCISLPKDVLLKSFLCVLPGLDKGPAVSAVQSSEQPDTKTA